MNESQAINNAQYEDIKKQINIILETIDRRFQEWSEDRKDISDLKVEIKTIKASLEGAREDIADNQKKVINEVKENLQSIPDVVSDTVIETMPGAIEVATSPQKRKLLQIPNKGFLKRLFRRK